MFSSRISILPTTRCCYWCIVLLLSAISKDAVLLTHAVRPPGMLQGPNGTLCFLGVHVPTLTLNMYVGAVNNYIYAQHLGIGMKFLGGANLNQLLRDVFHPDNEDCSMYVGPGSSSWSMTLNVVLPRIHLEHAAGAADLSEKLQFPFFSRINPSSIDQGAAIADTINIAGIKTFNVISSPDTFSASIARAVETQASVNGQTIDQFMFLPSFDETQVPQILYRLESSRMRWVVVSTNPTSPIFRAIFKLMVERDFFKDHQLVTSSGFCAHSVDPDVKAAFDGALCVDLWADMPRVRIAETFGRENGTAQIAALNDIQISGLPGVLDRSPSLSLNGYAVDAVRLGLTALSKAQAQGINPATDIPGLYRVLTQDTALTDGLTGYVAVNASDNGRIGSRLLLVNLVASTFVSIGVIEGGKLTQTTAIQYPGNRSLVPSERKPDLSKAGDDSSAVLAVALAVPLVVLVVLLTLVVVVALRSRRSSKCAPTDESQQIAVCFTDIEKSTILWERYPDRMGEVIDQHHSIVRDCVARHNGYEVKTIGDSFMVVFKEPTDSIQFAIDVQKALESAKWPDFIDETYETLHEFPGKVTYFGLRVRVAIHLGTCDIRKDENTHRYDYYGNTVNVAARVEGEAMGGQVLVSQSVMDALSADFVAKFITKSVGKRRLKGVEDSLELFEFTVPPFDKRMFPTSLDDSHFTDMLVSPEEYPSGRADTVSMDSSNNSEQNIINTRVWDVLLTLLSLCRNDNVVNTALINVAKAWRTTSRDPMQGLQNAVRRAERAVRYRHLQNEVWTPSGVANDQEKAVATRLSNPGQIIE